MPFPRPWTLVTTGPNEFMVADQDGRKLFYIVGDEGDEADGIEPSVLLGDRTMSLKQELTVNERFTCAYLHLVCGVEQQHLCIAFGVNIGRVSEAITAIELAASDPKVMRARMENPLRLVKESA